MLICAPSHHSKALYDIKAALRQTAVPSSSFISYDHDVTLVSDQWRVYALFWSINAQTGGWLVTSCYSTTCSYWVIWNHRHLSLLVVARQSLKQRDQRRQWAVIPLVAVAGQSDKIQTDKTIVESPRYMMLHGYEAYSGCCWLFQFHKTACHSQITFSYSYCKFMF